MEQRTLTTANHLAWSLPSFQFHRTSPARTGGKAYMTEEPTWQELADRESERERQEKEQERKRKSKRKSLKSDWEDGSVECIEPCY